jgi:hypothetical protein
MRQPLARLQVAPQVPVADGGLGAGQTRRSRIRARATPEWPPGGRTGSRDELPHDCSRLQPGLPLPLLLVAHTLPPVTTAGQHGQHPPQAYAS